MHDEHISPIKTPKQLAIVLVLAFLVPIALFLLLSQLVTGVRRDDTGATEAQVLARIKPVGEVTLAGATSARASMSGEQVFQAVCKTCHEPASPARPRSATRRLGPARSRRATKRWCSTRSTVSRRRAR